MSLSPGTLLHFSASVRVAKVKWHSGKRHLLDVDLLNLGGSTAPLTEGYYLGGVFVGNALIATIHVRVVP